MDYVVDTYRAVTSKTAQRTLLNSVLITAASVVLYGLAVVGYVLFYYNYLPQQVATVPVHLQYGYAANPYGVASLERANLKDLQAYDISVSLTLPRSPANLDRGNFMIALHLLDGRTSSSSPSKTSRNQPNNNPPPQHLASLVGGPSPAQRIPTDKPVLYSSTRPALLPYTHPTTSHAARALFLPWHVLFPRAAESARLVVPMAERLSFPRTHALPSELVLEVQAGQDLQVYEAAVVLTAQLSGLRFVMYHYRLASFVVLTGAFWACEVGCAVAAWGVLAVLLGGASGQGRNDRGEEGNQKGKGKTIKAEEGEEEGDGLSDTERMFPSTSRQMPLRFEGRIRQEEGEGEVKDENEDGEEGERGEGSGLALPPLAPGAEADDEEDDDGDDDRGGGRDSGIGTSYSDRPASGDGVRRRMSRGGGSRERR